MLLGGVVADPLIRLMIHQLKGVKPEWIGHSILCTNNYSETVVINAEVGKKLARHMRVTPIVNASSMFIPSNLTLILPINECKRNN